jgi:hypothetical protein
MIKFKEFEVSLGELGVFSSKIPRILWIKLNGKEIWDLQKIIDYELDIFRCGMECGRLENMWKEWEQTKIIGSKECPLCRSILK